MGQFGKELRRERESRGIALQTITESTKISSRHLSALEQDHFDRLPGGVFNKGIVRGYARVVGLDEDAWVDRYLSAYHASGMVQQDDADWVKFAENVVRGRAGEAERRTLRLRWAGVLLLMTLVAGLGWFVYLYVHEKVSAHGNQAPAPQIGATYLRDGRRDSPSFLKAGPPPTRNPDPHVAGTGATS